MITDKLGSYAAAKRLILPKVEHRSHKGLNNRVENSHVPLRKRERAMQGVSILVGATALSRSSPASAISLFHHVHIAPPSLPICIASTRWQSGNLLQP